MFRYVVEQNGRYYIMRYTLLGREWYDEKYKDGYWWSSWARSSATSYSSEEAAIEAYHQIDKRKAKYNGRVKLRKVYPK